MSIGKQTVINYVSYMTDSYLLFTLQNYAAKLVDKEPSPKYYFMDTGLLGLMLLDCKSCLLYTSKENFTILYRLIIVHSANIPVLAHKIKILFTHNSSRKSC